MNKMIETVIIGAGPAGLAVAGRLHNMKRPFEILEKTDKIASAWHEHYDRLCLHTVKQLSHLPHLPFPDDYPLYVPRLDLVRYFEDYAKRFDIKPHFSDGVTAVQKKGEKWSVETEHGKTYEAAHVVIASGLNRVPNRPTWVGEAQYKGAISHSRVYKNPDPFIGKRTLVIGMGNTGAEIALDLAENGVDVTISVRSPITIVPRDVMGNPVQLTAKTLDKLPFGLGDWLGTQVRKVVIGDLTKYGVPMSTMHPAVQLRETGKTPLIDLGTVSYIKSGQIKIVNDIERFTEQGVLLKTGEENPYDAVILATGYNPSLDEFINQIEPELDRFDLPKSPIAQLPANKGLYFVGFDNYKLGGILGTVFNDSKTIAEDIAASVREAS
ncbi:MAG: NAD(P)/FAD-dependent oxidoreductase [Chloroflexota bacterium]